MTKQYTEDHEWVEAEGGIATVGITHHAQDALGEIGRASCRERV